MHLVEMVLLMVSACDELKQTTDVVPGSRQPIFDARIRDGDFYIWPKVANQGSVAEVE